MPRLLLAAAGILFALAAVRVHAQDTCNLLTSAQIASVLGHTVTATPGPKDCIWNSSDHSGTRVYLTLRDPSTWSSFKSMVASTGHLTPASGIGDDAFYMGKMLYVLKGSHVALISVNGAGFTEAQNQAAEKTLASSAIASF